MNFSIPCLKQKSTRDREAVLKDFLLAIAFDDVFDNGNNFVFGQSGVEKNRAAVFGKALFTVQTIQEVGSCGAIFSANAVFRAFFIVANFFKSSTTGLLMSMS